MSRCGSTCPCASADRLTCWSSRGPWRTCAPRRPSSSNGASPSSRWARARTSWWPTPACAASSSRSGKASTGGGLLPPRRLWRPATGCRTGGRGGRGQRMEAWRAQRTATQPIGPPSSGCVFRNPEGDHAGRLIEAAGAKGLAVGDAVISEIHANYIVNRDRATAAQVLTLIEQVRERVRRASGRELDLEIKLLGES